MPPSNPHGKSGTGRHDFSSADSFHERNERSELQRAIQGLTQSVIRMESGIGNITEKVDEIQEEIKEIKRDIEHLSDAVSGAERDRAVKETAMTARLANLEEKVAEAKSAKAGAVKWVGGIVATVLTIVFSYLLGR